MFAPIAYFSAFLSFFGARVPWATPFGPTGLADEHCHLPPSIGDVAATSRLVLCVERNSTDKLSICDENVGESTCSGKRYTLNTTVEAERLS